MARKVAGGIRMFLHVVNLRDGTCSKDYVRCNCRCNLYQVAM